MSKCETWIRSTAGTINLGLKPLGGLDLLKSALSRIAERIGGIPTDNPLHRMVGKFSSTVLHGSRAILDDYRACR